MTGPQVEFPKPHAPQGLPSAGQLRALRAYIQAHGPMSIYGDSGNNLQLERLLCRTYGTKYCILTNSGTSALSSGYFGLGITSGDEVVVPTYTFMSTVTPLLRLGARIVFCDADPATGNASPRELNRVITRRTKLVVVTHMWGVPSEMDEISRLVREAGAKLLEDCSHAHLTPCNGRLLGTFGDVACFSIGAKKTMTCGEGGFLLTQDPEVYIRATLLGHFEMRAKDAVEVLRRQGLDHLVGRYQHLTVGFGENYRMHPYGAVMAHSLLQTGELKRLIAMRSSSLRYLHSRLSDLERIEPPSVPEDYFKGAMFGYKARALLGSKAALLKMITSARRRNALVKLPDSMPLHPEPMFRGSGGGAFPGAWGYLSGRFSIPTFSRGVSVDGPLVDQYIDVLDYLTRR